MRTGIGLTASRFQIGLRGSDWNGEDTGLEQSSGKTEARNALASHLQVQSSGQRNCATHLVNASRALKFRVGERKLTIAQQNLSGKAAGAERIGLAGQGDVRETPLANCKVSAETSGVQQIL